MNLRALLLIASILVLAGAARGEGQAPGEQVSTKAPRQKNQDYHDQDQDLQLFHFPSQPELFAVVMRPSRNVPIPQITIKAC